MPDFLVDSMLSFAGDLMRNDSASRQAGATRDTLGGLGQGDDVTPTGERRGANDKLLIALFIPFERDRISTSSSAPLSLRLQHRSAYHGKWHGGIRQKPRSRRRR